MAFSAISYKAKEHFEVKRKTLVAWQEYYEKSYPCVWRETIQKEYKVLKKVKDPNKKLNQEQKDAEEQRAEIGIQSAGTINYRFLVDAKYIESKIQENVLIKQVLKNLIFFLYSETNFFKESGRGSEIVDELFISLLTSQEGPQKMVTLKKLDKLELEPPSIREFWYQILSKSYPSSKVAKILGKEDGNCPQISLYDYLGNRSFDKIRVYLASRGLLYAIFQDEEVVERIIEERNRLYKRVRAKSSNNISKEDATKEFKEFSRGFQGAEEFDLILDYSVTTTDPKDYNK